MKYICQFAVIGAVSLAGEVLHVLLPFPVPASVYGMCLMFLGLCSGLIRLSWVEETADFMLAVMPVFFIEPSVKLMTSFGLIRGSVLPLCVLCFASWLFVFLLTGRISQTVIRLRRRKNDRAGKGQEKEEVQHG